MLRCSLTYLFGYFLHWSHRKSNVFITVYLILSAGLVKNKEMVQFSSIFNGFKKSLAIKNGRKSGHDFGREVANTLAKEAKKNELMLTSSGCVACGSKNSVSFFSKGGKKGINQDRFIVWEV